MKKKELLLIVALMLTFVLSGCTAVDTNLENELESKNKAIATLEEEKLELENRITELMEEQEQEEEPAPTSQNSLLQTALNVVEVINDEDMQALSDFVHPIKGVKFSAYGHINVSSDLTFINTQVANLMNDTEVYTWGNYDGSGEPINLNFADYFDEFVYDEAYNNPNVIGNNVSIAQGNIINNIAEAYPNGEFVDFHFTGFEPQFEGLDWSSLKLVFEEDNGTWYLVGIVHDQWTV